jgi:nitrous oxidase accessory protein NosD
MRRRSSVLAVALVVTALIGGALAAPVAASAEVWVVDDDRAQCGHADFRSIDKAVESQRVESGDVIQVCPGTYRESVTIAKSITLRGDPEAIDAIDCFQLSLPIDPATHAIIDPVSAAPEPNSFGLKLREDQITVEGLVFQDGWVGIDASDEYSAYRITQNIFRSHSYFGIEFGSNGKNQSRVDHNCFWQNATRVGEAGGGMGSELDDPYLDITLPANRTLANARDLANATIDHNRTFRNNESLTAFGPGLRVGVVFEGNLMRDDRIGILVQHSRTSAIIANDIATPEIWPVRKTPTGGQIATSPILVGGDNDGLHLKGNLVTGGRIGLTFQAAGGFDVFPVASRANLVEANVVTGAGRHGIAMAPMPTTGVAAGVPSLLDSTFVGNTSSQNGFNGILITAGSTGNDFESTTADGNGGNGVFVMAGASSNTFLDNSMHGNGWNPAVLAPFMAAPKVDARDDNTPINSWTNTSCDTDYPVDAICVSH